MYRHVLAPTDGSPIALEGMRAAVQLAKAMGARLTFIACSTPLEELVLVPPSARQRAEYDQAVEAAARVGLDAGHALASAADIAAESVHASAAQPWRAILDAAETRGCDVIVMASHGRGGVSGLLGSQTRKVLAHSSLPVLVVR